MRDTVGDALGVKASGGVRTREDAWKNARGWCVEQLAPAPVWRSSPLSLKPVWSLGADVDWTRAEGREFLRRATQVKTTGLPTASEALRSTTAEATTGR